MSIAIATTWQDRLHDLGNIPASRIRTDPAPGTATVDDVTRLRNTEKRLYELVDGTLVEKSIGWQEWLLAGILLQWLNNYLDSHRIGVATGTARVMPLLKNQMAERSNVERCLIPFFCVRFFCP